jgi:hypothetical protein
VLDIRSPHPPRHCMLASPSMLRTIRRDIIYKVHPNYPASSLTRGNAFSRSVLVVGRCVAASSVRHYAQTPPGGSGNAGGFPGFKFPMQQQYSKGDALKEFVRARGAFVGDHGALLSDDLCPLHLERRLDGTRQGWEA